VEGWSRGIRLLDEWTCFDVVEPRIGAIYVFRHWRPIRYMQWTVHYLLGPKGRLV